MESMQKHPALSQQVPIVYTLSHLSDPEPPALADPSIQPPETANAQRLLSCGKLLSVVFHCLLVLAYTMVT